MTSVYKVQFFDFFNGNSENSIETQVYTFIDKTELEIHAFLDNEKITVCQRHNCLSPNNITYKFELIVTY